ncbi:hypothetical protein VSR82_07855 [Burkholderia sp. JPY481]
MLIAPILALAQSYPSPTFNNLTVNGTFTATGKVGLPSLAAQAANTVVANVTGSSASPTAFAMPSCSTSTSALQYTSGTGFACITGFAPLASPNFTGTVTIPGGTINNASVGATTPSTGSFTTLAASSTVSGTGFSTYLASPPAIGGTAAAAGSFTTLSASSTVSGTGFSNYLASPPAIGGTTAAAGKFTTLQATSTITPSSTAGIVGTTTNDNANAGSVGEYQTNTTSGTSLTTATAANATSISLTAGDWDVSGVIRFNPGGSATTSNMTAGISTTSATIGALGTFTANLIPFGSVSGGNSAVLAPTVRISLSTTTTVYLIGLCVFSASTMTEDGFIRARRVR